MVVSSLFAKSALPKKPANCTHLPFVQDFPFLLQNPGPRKGSEGFEKGVAEGVSEGFSKGFRKVLEGSSSNTKKKPLQKPFRDPFSDPLLKPFETFLGSGGSVAVAGNESLDLPN